MARTKIPFQSDVPVIFRAPTDVVNQNALDNTNDGSTSTFKVYDMAKDEVLSADEAALQPILSVTNASAFKVGDSIEVDLDDGTVHSAGLVTFVDPVLGTITIQFTLASQASAGNRVRVRLGTQITMVEFGTAKIGRRDYGFIGILSDTHPGLEIDLEIDVEIRFVGAPGGGLDALEILCLVVKPRADCRGCD
jgi:hypothetical protein